MPLPRQILAALGPQMHPTPAAHRAIELARRAGAALHLCMPAFDARVDAACRLDRSELGRLAQAGIIEPREQWLAQWVGELAGRGLTASSEVIWTAHFDEALIARALDRSPDLLLADLRRVPRLGRGDVVCSEVRKLARICPVPLMLVQERSALLPARICAAVDAGSKAPGAAELDERTLDVATGLAQLAKASLDLVHVFPFRPADAGESQTFDNVVARMRDEDRQAFDRFADRHGVAAEHRVPLEGNPTLELLRHADARGTELMAIGSEYRSAFDRFFLGSTAESLLDQLHCDLLIVRRAGFSEELARHRDLDRLHREYPAPPS